MSNVSRANKIMPISSRKRTDTRLPTGRCGALVVVIVLPIIFVVVFIIVVPVVIIPVIVVVIIVIIDSDGWGRSDRCRLGWWRGGFGFLRSYRLLRGHRFLRFI